MLGIVLIALHHHTAQHNLPALQHKARDMTLALNIADFLVSFLGYVKTTENTMYYI